MKTLIIGATEKTDRYANIAMYRLRQHEHEVVAIGKRKGRVEDINIETGFPAFENIHTITLYLNSANQQPYYEYIVGLKPQRVIFNPGAENHELEKMLTDKGILVLEACTLVMLATGEY